MFKARDYLNIKCLSNLYHTYKNVCQTCTIPIKNVCQTCTIPIKNVCQTCTIPIYFHISFTALKCGVMRPIVTYFPCFYSVNPILETFSSYRTYIQIIKYSSTQQSLLSQNLTFNV